MNASMRHSLRIAFKVAVTLVFLAVTFRVIRPAVLLARARAADPGPLFMALLLLLTGGFAGAASWWCILRTRLPGLAYRRIAAWHWMGMFFNSFLPSNIGGDVVKGVAAARDAGQTGFVVTSVLLDRALNLGVLLGIGAVALLLQTGRLAGAAGLVAGSLALMPLAGASARRLGRPQPRDGGNGIRGMLAALALAVIDWVAAPRLFLPAVAAALVSQLCKTWSHVYVIRAFGLELPEACVWTLIPLFGMVSALPLSIGGLGVREWVAQRMAGPMRLDETHLVALSLGGHLVVVLVNMLGAVSFLSFRGRSGKSPHSQVEKPAPRETRI